MGRKNPAAQARGGKGKGARRYGDIGAVSRRDRYGDVDYMTRPDSAVDQAGNDDDEEAEAEDEDGDEEGT